MKLKPGTKFFPINAPKHGRNAYLVILSSDVVDDAYWVSLHNFPNTPEGYRSYVYYPNLVAHFKQKLVTVLPLP